MGKYINNIGLFLSGVFTMFSGMFIQLKYHIGNHNHIKTNQIVFNLDYKTWSYFHKISIVIFSLLMIFHFYQHWKFYKIVFTKKIITKNKQVIVLTLVFVFVAITGFIPWFIDVLNGNDIIRKSIIEVHDKIAIILTIYLILHIKKRIKWFLTTLKSLKV
ncbi:MAG TPA: DUF4405 domain-containing protein [Candidatus Paceibacterota bacterium]|nr:DUF4405 domain-containing protein [Candidatus Paceibacterota bacterium]